MRKTELAVAQREVESDAVLTQDHTGNFVEENGKEFKVHYRKIMYCFELAPNFHRK